ncbi:hypothetical protein F0225_05820 [Vibrio pectenicida]|uniref:Uncharacterized protein n=2 Tax=Vibrio pectenicida TaxID=62763 RepID=A0A427U6Q2_9VIBR|nr:hypothetical protein [Vibrio pectenicida]NOH70859.1 hypothetical protein [Vibrio pectenicida]RSD32338.1 hypothetical protein EJA03_04195 [Vibrio pectenicida]
MRHNWFKFILMSTSLYSFTAYSQPFESVIVTSGQGGDYHAGLVLKDLIPNSKQVDVDAFGELNPGKRKCQIIFGQGAADKLLTNKEFIKSFSKEPLAIYSHLLDPSILDFVKHHVDNGGRINLFVTDSQLNKLKLSSPLLYKKTQSKESNIKVYSAPLAASSIVPDDNVHISAPKLDNVIWFGGNYTNSKGRRETFTTKQFADSLNQIKGSIATGSSIGLFLMPRLFTNDMTRNEKSARVQALVNRFPNNKVIIFASQDLLSQFSVTSETSVPSSYTRLMLSDWGNTRQFASVDQYNIFSDLSKYTVTPFLINDEDQDQVLYAKTYLAAKKNPVQQTNIMQLIEIHQCSSSM